MIYNINENKITQQEGVEKSTMMKTPCLRYKGEFMTMFFEKEDCLIIKVSPDRVQELIAQGRGMEFNYTGKPFKEWVLIPTEFEDDYDEYIDECLQYAKQKVKK